MTDRASAAGTATRERRVRAAARDTAVHRPRVATALPSLAALALTALLLAGCSADSAAPAGSAAAKPGASDSPTPVAGSAAGGSAPGSSRDRAPKTAVTGTVNNGVHKGDLRFFLLPVPDGAEPSGAAAGDRMTVDEAAIGHRGDAVSTLRDLGFRQAAHRSYHTADGAWEIDVKLIHLGSPASAQAFSGASGPEGTREPLPGDPRARAVRLESAAAESTDSFVAVSYEGDVHITVTVTGVSRATPAQLAEVLQRQYARLRTGR